MRLNNPLFVPESLDAVRAEVGSTAGSPQPARRARRAASGAPGARGRPAGCLRGSGAVLRAVEGL